MATVDLASAGIPGEAVDRRSARRQRVLKAAVAAFNQEFSTYPCIVRNISDTGAKLEFADPTQVPSSFVLHVELDGFKVECERVWQHGHDCGVRFIGERKPIRVMRTQVLKSSQNALGENIVRDMARREAYITFVAAPVADHAEPANPSPAAKKPVFGKRV